MKERQIIFSAPMVRAILEGRKTQTRRVVKPRPPAGHTFAGFTIHSTLTSDEGKAVWRAGNTSAHLRDAHRVRCPYGQPGDRLLVREAWRTYASLDDIPPRGIAPGAGVQYEAGGSNIIGTNRLHGMGKLRQGMFMPRWASRITLEIVSVRVKRLQDMEGQAPYEGECDALAEGVNSIHYGDGCYYYSAFRDEPHPKNWCDPTDAFRELWESINGPRTWDENPWAWVIEFKAVTP